MDAEQFSIEWTCGYAWSKYNPKWLVEKVDNELQNAPNDPVASQIFNVADVRQAFMDGFKMGIVYKITGEMPEEGGE